MIVLAVDPGPKESAAVLYDSTGPKPILGGMISENDEVRRWVQQEATYNGNVWNVAIEEVGHYGTGMPAGREVFDTCKEIGRLIEACHEHAGVRLILRATIKTHLCGTPRAKDANVRQALLDLPRWQEVGLGGGATPAVGTKAKPGPLYGIKSHLWSALAVAVVAADLTALDAPTTAALAAREDKSDG